SSTANRNKKTTPYFIYTKGTTNLKEGNVSVDIFPDTFYEDYYLDFKVKNDTLYLEEDLVPLKRAFNISFDISKYADADRSKLYIARLTGAKKYPVYENTQRKGHILSASIKNLGTFTLARDNVKPIITPVNFKNNQWMSDFRYLKVKISDSQTDISNFRA